MPPHPTDCSQTPSCAAMARSLLGIVLLVSLTACAPTAPQAASTPATTAPPPPTPVATTPSAPASGAAKAYPTQGTMGTDVPTLRVEELGAYFPHAAPNPHASVAYQWVDLLEEAAARRVQREGNPKPTIISRDMMITCVGMYDAWACYDAVAVGTRFGGRLRRPLAERTQANKQVAISVAATRCLEDLYPEDRAWVDAQARRMGIDPDLHPRDRTSPAGIGETVAQALLAFRHRDGANQLGDEAGSDGTPYSDYTMYAPQRVVGAQPDPNAWMPIPFSDGKGGTIRPGFLTPQWYRVLPVGLTHGCDFRPGPPPLADSEVMRRDVDECIAANAHLSLPQKALVEFMRDGPKSTGQSGHWMHFAQDLSRRDHYDLDRDVQLFFCVGSCAFDAFVACWDAKRFYNSSRPYWYVRYNRQGQMVRGYAGPGQGVKALPADHWAPYSPATFVTPPFPGYTSGHATVSGACGKMLALFSGSDRLGAYVEWTAGQLTEPGSAPAKMQAVDGTPSGDQPGDAVIRIRLATFSQTADLAALSRMLGGYHIRTDNEVGLDMGRKLAVCCFAHYMAYVQGTAPAPKDPPL